MNVSLNWLSALLGSALDADDVVHRLAMLGAPVDVVERLHDGLDDVLVAVVDSVERHPNADRLSLCRVNAGAGVVEVVCGAANVRAGAKYPYAPVGTTLPGGLTLTPRKIRGVVSHGMLCSARELELGTDHEGILELVTDAEPGVKLTDALPLADVRLEIDVTPNRPDLLGHKGVARDLGASLGLPVKLEPIPGAPAETRAPVRVERRGVVDGIGVEIQDVDGCPRYLAAVVRGVRVGPSPGWLQARLRNIGQRPINNVVDATNYVMQELNQPLHAFDAEKLGGSRIVVRRAREGERITTLDGEERVLDGEMTAICDAADATAVGGVMGGAASEVSAETTDVVIECAYFDPRRIRATRTALRMSTDASYRFERGTDHQGMAEALRRAVALTIAVAGGVEREAPVDVYPRPMSTPTVFLRPARVARLLGVELPRAEIEGLLTRLGFSVAPKDDRLAVQVPGWRPDVKREVDLIEEIARLRGYDAFEADPHPFRPSAVPDDPSEGLKDRCRTVLTGMGLMEARSSPLGPARGEAAQPVLRPLSAEEGHLRADLISGLVRAVEYNWSVRERDVRLFEIGRVFRNAGEGVVPVETLRVAGVITGARVPPHWSDSGKSVDFDPWDVKSLFEAVARCCAGAWTLGSDGGNLAIRDGSGGCRGWAGPLQADAPAWAAPVFGFEMDLEEREASAAAYAPLAEMPPVERDLALVVPDGVSAGAVGEAIGGAAGDHLESAVPFDEYRGSDIAGRSVAWRLVFRAPDRTLRDKEVDRAVANILKALEERLGVERREA